MGNLERAKNITTMEKLVQGTVQNSTSGTSIDFTGIPSWAKKITVMFNGVSTSGASNIQVQIGNTTIQTTGYLSFNSRISGTAVATLASTSGFLLNSYQTATDSQQGQFFLINISNNTWTSTSSVYSTGYLASQIQAGSVTLSGTLDRIRVTTVNGTDTFDAGQINIMYEG